MHNQRRIVTLLRWVMFLALAYLLWASGDGTTLFQLGLLAVVAATNVALGRLSPELWEHPALLPVIAALDIGVLTASMLYGQGFARDFFFAYFVLLAMVAMLPSLRWATVATALVVGAYGAFLMLQEGWVMVHDPALLGRLGFLFTIGVGYGGLTEAGKVRLREAALQGQLTGWVGKLSAAFSDDFDAFDVIRQILLDVQNIYPVAVRASVVQVTDASIQVIGSSDDPELRELPLDPERYPELLAAIDGTEPLVIEDIRESAATAGVQDLVSDLDFNSLLLCPVNLGDASIGHMILRVARQSGPFTPGIVRTTQNVAEAIAVIFRQAKDREQLERSERMEMVSQVTTSVAHNFNGILSTVLLASESLRKDIQQRGVDEDDHRRRFDSIELAVREGMTIVERLAAWTRLDRTADGHDESRHALVDPATLLEEAWRYARPHFQRREATRDLQLRLEVGEAPRIHGHAAELREVVLNLILNAIDAMPRGGVMTLGLQQDQGQVCISVSDTGVGMSEEQVARAFEPLYTTKGTGGTGLGLTIARTVVSRHGGVIRVESAQGVGSTFRVWLPIAEDAAGAGDNQDTRDSRAAASGGRLLLVEPNHLVRDVMVRFLQTLGMEVDVVDTSDEATVMVGTGRGYAGLVVDADSAAPAAREFLSALDSACAGLASRVLFYSTRGVSPDLRELRDRYHFGFVDRSAGLAALTEALTRQLGEIEPGDEAAA